MHVLAKHYLGHCSCAFRNPKATAVCATGKHQYSLLLVMHFSQGIGMSSDSTDVDMRLQEIVSKK